jgi:hypothetical protein
MCYISLIGSQPESRLSHLFAFIMAFTFHLLHASDQEAGQEAGVPAFQDAIGLSAVLNALSR